ncbi:DUF3179 domain-containing protein [Candidatus Kaiserbacteria bacterium]|nr:MAG: DUF3179 domain-containing protein [Candidatus Kaiserbacteria bacterium]
MANNQESEVVSDVEKTDSAITDTTPSEVSETTNTQTQTTPKITADDGFKGIPEDEILSGGPGKDGIPSIDEPKFISVEKATFLDDDDFGMGIVHGDVARFYPFQILVWHEIVNDVLPVNGSVEELSVAVTYCPLCRTGVTYERRVDDEVVEFGVSGKLWKSNLLMYNRTNNEDNESLWSQVLGRAVTGVHTGKRLTIVPSDTVKFGDWKKQYPETQVLSKDTGAIRIYGRDPYGDYYTNRDVSFGATFSDARLHPKEYVLGVEHEGNFKAYVADSLPVGVTTDTFAGETITITKSEIGEVRMNIGDTPFSYIGGFWFSWLAVHPETELML